MKNIKTLVIATRIELITRYIDSLKRFESISLDDYLNNFERQLIVERLIQLMIQAALDINDHILSRLNPGNTASSFEAFIELGKRGIITLELARQLAPSAGLRNRLVLEYDDIDSKQVFKAINFALQQYTVYVQQMNYYLISLDVDNG